MVARRRTTASRSPTTTSTSTPAAIPRRADARTCSTASRTTSSYGVRVQACNDVGCGPYSGWEYATPDRPVSVGLEQGRGPPRVSPAAARCTAAGSTSAPTGLTPGQQYAITCWDNVNGRADEFTSYATAHGNNGDLSAGNVCYFGYPDRTFWVRLEPGGHEGPHRQFGS